MRRDTPARGGTLTGHAALIALGRRASLSLTPHVSLPVLEALPAAPSGGASFLGGRVRAAMAGSEYINNPKHWMGRATEMRTLAKTVPDVETRTVMLRLAADYDKLAGRAEERADGRRPRRPTAR